MLSIDLSNKEYFIILKDGKEFVRINRRLNKLEDVKNFFQIKTVKEVR